MAKSINEINALNSVNKVQALPEVQKPKRGGGSKRARAVRTSAAGSQTSRAGKAATSGLGRATQKKQQRTAARNLFAQDVHLTGDSLHANNLAVTSPLTTLAPGASVRTAAGQRPVLLMDTAGLPAQYQPYLPKSGRVSIGQLYRALAPSIGSTKAYAFCQQILNDRWESFVEAEKQWQEDEALQAKLSKEASERAQKRAAEQKHADAASRAQAQTAFQAAQATLNAKRTLEHSAQVRHQVRPRVVSAPKTTSVISTSPAASTGGGVIMGNTVDAVDNTPTMGLFLTVAPTNPASRPSPASPNERGARQAKRLRQSADAEMT